MNRGHAAALLLSFSLGLPGCIGISTQMEGNPIEDEQLEQIEVGTTTRAQVLELLGSPLVIDRTDITGLAERALARYQGEELTLKIDPSLFNDVYIYERRYVDRFAILLGVFNYVSSDERSDRLSVFFDKNGVVLGVGWTPGSEDL
jgi:hypothetical protein